MVFFITFAGSALFGLLSERTIDKRHQNQVNALSLVLATIAVVTLSVLNGIRDYSIGTDIDVYGNAVYEAAVRSDSLRGLYQYCVNTIGLNELGYVLLNYVISFFSQSPHTFYFILGLLTNGLIYFGIVRMRNYVNIPIAWLTYLFLFYATTLNLLRQSLALAIVFVMLTYAVERKYWVSALLVVLATSIHFSAVISGSFLLFIIILQWSGKTIGNKLVLFCFYLASALLPSFIAWLNTAGYLVEKYSQYVDSAARPISLVYPVLIRLPFVVAAVIIIIRKRTLPPLYQVLYSFIIAEMLLIPLQLISLAAFRISLYFAVFKVAGYTVIVEKMKSFIFIRDLLYISFLVFYFWWQIIFQGSNEVYPFVLASDLNLL